MTFSVSAFLAAALVFAEGDHHESQDVPADPANPWIGVWESIDGRQENFENFVKKIGKFMHAFKFNFLFR